MLIKLEGLNPRPYGDNEKAKLLKLREKMWFLSSRFYEFIPHEEFRNKMVPPISNMNMLMQKSQNLLTLIQIEMASKILLGAFYRCLNFNMNPLEYCIRAAGVKFDVLEHSDPEYNLISTYVNNTYSEVLQAAELPRRKYLHNIVKLEKPSAVYEGEEIGNRMLLFHGSRVSNFLGILSQGLRSQPLEANKNGALLGDGIYFSDMAYKAMQYCGDSHGSRYILACEVALGAQKSTT